jgi:hypothetical protein
MKKLIIIILTAFTSLASYSQQKTQYIGLPDNTVEVRNKLRIDALKDATGDSVMVVDAGGNVKLKAITDFTGIGGGGTSGPDSLYLENPIYSVKEVNENGDTIQVIKFRADSLPELRYAAAMRDTNNWVGSTLVDVDYLNDRISGLGAGGSNNPDSTTASNGLTLVGKDVQLGGTLTKNTDIATGSYQFSLSGTSANAGNNVLKINDTGDGTAVSVGASTGIAIYGFSTSTGVGGYFKSDGGQGLIGESYSGIGVTGRSSLTYPISADKTVTNTNDLTGGLKVSQTVASTAVAGFGTSIDYILTTAFPTSRISNQLISKWTDAADATRSSEFSIAGVYGGVTNTLFTLAGNGQLTLNKYGTGAFSGTPTYALKVDATGKVIEVPNSTNYTVVTMVDNAGSGLSPNTFTVFDAAGTIPTYQLQLAEPALNGDIIEVKFTAAVTTLTYGGTGTVVGGRTSALQGEYMKFIYKSSVHAWY